MPPLVKLTNVSISVGSTTLLDGVTAQLTTGQCVALVGANGCGKSTLLRAVGACADGEDDDEQDMYYTLGAGTVECAEDDGVLYVEQDTLHWKRLFPGVDMSEDEVRECTVADAIDMALGGGMESAAEDGEVWRRLCVAAGDALHWRTAHYDTTPICALSPGCALRAYLAVALHRASVSLLLLDEATNHLDVASLLWLERAIQASGKSVLVISHDAAFLDAVCTHLWVVDSASKTIKVSGARYTDFRAAEALKRRQQAAAYEAQQTRSARLTAVANKLRAASTAGAFAVGPDPDKLQRDFRRDRAGRSGAKAKAVERMRDRVDEVERVVQREPLRIAMDPLGAGTDASLQLRGVVLGHYGEPLDMPPVSLRIDFGERVVLVGYNGVGKTTMVKTLIGALPPLSGEVHVGRELRIGDLMQMHEALPRDTTPREYLAAQMGASLLDAGSHLYRYGLRRDQMESSIATLNPGARARTLLCRCSMCKVNALVLDEPTNHLTITTSPPPPPPPHHHHHHHLTTTTTPSPPHHHHLTITTSPPPPHHHHLTTTTSPPPPHHHHLTTTTSPPPPHHHHLTTTTSPPPPHHGHLTTSPTDHLTTTIITTSQ